MVTGLMKYYNAMIIALIVAIFLMLFMVTFILYQVSHRPLPIFTAVASDGKKMPLTAFYEPNYLPNTVLRWASKAAVASYTFDFVNYNQQVQNAAPYYTRAGWLAYRSSVQDLINSITQKQLFVNSVVSGAPVIANQGQLPGKGYAWRVQMPFLVTYQSSEVTTRNSYYVILTIVKVPTNVDPTGIGIGQFIMR